MRNLSKKISILLVLAMLVGMFGGVVSASAASSWSFPIVKADDEAKVGTAVAVNGTIELVSKEFVDFDLAKSDLKKINSLYTVEYKSSDENVIWIDAKNGKARADKFGKAKAGDTAKVSATFTNKETKKSATRSFNVKLVGEEADAAVLVKIGKEALGDQVLYLGDTYELTATTMVEGKEVKEATVAYTVNGKEATAKFTAEAVGEYEIVATASVAKEVVATTTYTVVVENNNMFEAAQVSMKAIKLTFPETKDAKKIAKDDITVYSAAAVDGAKYKEYVSGVEGKDNVLTVNLYNDMVKDQYITVVYRGEENGFKVFKGDVTGVVLNSGKVLSGDARKLDIKVMSGDIDITDTNQLSKVTVEIIKGSENANIINGNQIFFWEANKEAVVKATYHTYTYNTTDGKENVFVSNEATITSVTTTNAYENINTFVVTNQGDKNKIVWDGKTRVAIGDVGYKLVGKVNKITSDVSSKTDAIVTFEADDLSYESSDNAVIMVGSDGTLYPITTGSADIIVKKDKTIIGICTVTVVAKRAPKVLTASVDKAIISQNDQVLVSVTVTDQYGDYYGNTVDASEGFTNVQAGGTTITAENQQGDGKYPIKGTNLGSANGSTYTVKVKKGDAVGYISFTVKNADSDDTKYSYKLDQATMEIDTKIASNDKKTFDELYGAKTIKIASYDKNGLLVNDNVTDKLIGIIPNISSKKIGGKISESGDETYQADKYYITVDYAQSWNKVGANISVTGGSIEVQMVSADPFGNITKAAPGNYTIRLYKANAIGGTKENSAAEVGFAYVGATVITVKDTQPQYVVSLKKVNSDTAFATIESAVVTDSNLNVTTLTNGDNTVDNAVLNELDNIFGLKLDNKDVTFAGKASANNLTLIAMVNKNIAFKEIKWADTFTFKDSDSKNLVMTINLGNSSIQFK